MTAPSAAQGGLRPGAHWADPAEKHMFERLAGLPPGHSGRVRIRQELARRHQRLVEMLARRFTHRGESLEDLIQSGNVGLVKAIDRFDINRGNAFTTYAVPMILGEIRRHFRDAGWALHVPRRMQTLKILVHAAMDDLVQEFGRRPTSHELAQTLNLSMDEVRDGLRADSVYSCLSLDAMIDEENHPADSLSVAHKDEGLELVDDRESLWPLLDDLPDRERTVLVLRFYGNQTQSEIAAQLGVSQVQVSRLQSRACSHLREQLVAA